MPDIDTSGSEPVNSAIGSTASCGRTVRFLLALFLIIAAAEFVWRGPVRAMSSSNDVKALYLGARAWWDGVDPYNEITLRRLWRESGGASDNGVTSHLPVSVYPPPSHLVMAPVSRLSWPWFKIVWMLGNVFFYAISIGAVMRVASISRTWVSCSLFSGLALALAPAHTAIAMGQVSAMCLALVLVSELWGREKGREVSAGAALALAVALKPHVAGPFVIYHLLLRRYKIGFTTTLLVAVISLLAVVRLSAAGVEWLTPLLDNLALLRQEGGVNDPSAAGKLNYQHLNLHYLLHCFTDSRAAVQSLATFILLGCGAIGAWATASYGATFNRPAASLLALSFWSVFMLLAAYHRFYDAVFLIIPLAWAFVSLKPDESRARLDAILVLAAILIFLVPGASLLARGFAEGWIPATIGDSWIGRTIIMPHQVWALIVIFVVLLVRLARDHSGEKGEYPQAALSAG